MVRYRIFLDFPFCTSRCKADQTQIVSVLKQLVKIEKVPRKVGSGFQDMRFEWSMVVAQEFGFPCIVICKIYQCSNTPCP